MLRLKQELSILKLHHTQMKSVIISLVLDLFRF